MHTLTIVCCHVLRDSRWSSHPSETAFPLCRQMCYTMQSQCICKPVVESRGCSCPNTAKRLKCGPWSYIWVLDGGWCMTNKYNNSHAHVHYHPLNPSTSRMTNTSPGVPPADSHPSPPGYIIPTHYAALRFYHKATVRNTKDQDRSLVM